MAVQFASCIKRCITPRGLSANHMLAFRPFFERLDQTCMNEHIIEKRDFIMPQAYRLLRYDFDQLCVLSPVAQNPVDVTPGRRFLYQDGILLNQSPDTRDSILLETDSTLVRLTFDYDAHDLVDPTRHADETFLLNQATLKSTEFQDPEMQQRFGHLLSPAIAQERRSIMRRESLQDVQGKRLYGVVRAMDARSQHTHAMDYVYLAEPATLKGVAEAVIKAYENGDAPRTRLQKMLAKTLEHAVTTAIYEGLPQHVTFALASTSELYRAPNEGEFFFDSPKPLKMQSLICVDEHGALSLPNPAAKKVLGQNVAACAPV